MKHQNSIIDFIIKEWLLFVSAAGVIITSIYIRQLPSYSLDELEVLFILFALFLSVNGLQRHGVIANISQRLERGKAIPLKLVLATFFLSMIITNDAALIVIVPLTLSLNINHKDILVIFEALAANAGSAFTPFGNPQNLFIYWFYELAPAEFIATIAPFSLVFLVLLAIPMIFVKIKNHNKLQGTKTQDMGRFAYLYAALLSVVILSVLHLLPVYACAAVVLFALLFDRKTLRIDYTILISFFFFFGLADNLGTLLESEIEHSGNIFVFSALVSQIISNVPTALLFAEFTTEWKALLWGTNVGGFGSLFGSLANLIAYKLYVANKDTSNIPDFTRKFLLFGYIAFFISMGLYFTIYGF